jgi:hypothetical protein
MSSPGTIPQNVLLISENKLKNFTDIDPNVTSSVLLPFISVRQQNSIEYIIGARYYKSLLTQVADNTIQNNPTDYDFLTYFVQPALIWGAYSECLPSVFMRIKNNGIVNGSEQTVTIKDMQYMQQRADDRSQFFEQRMIEQIIFNSNLYPLCFGYTTRDGLVPHLGKNYFSGVHLYNGQWTNSPGYMMQTYGLQSYSDPSFRCCGL